VIPLLHVDAFTDTAFRGNPAAVCLLDRRVDDAGWLQSVAAEMNLSETAFVAPRPDGDLDLRWFTPTVEVDLCGHATLASAHALWETGRLDSGESAHFHTRSGVLVARPGEGAIEMDFPARPVTPAIVAGIEALGTPHRPLGTFDNGHQLVIELDDAQAVRATSPDFAALGRAADRVWVVTAPAPDDSEADFVSRCFGPRYGIDEDPVTGSAHCALAPFWAERFGRTELVGHQISSRGGRVAVQLRGQRVTLAGTAVTVVRGDLLA
jgi:PhzF family phenazine biosynthesis protein